MFLTYNELRTKHSGIEMPWIEYYSVIQAIPIEWKTLLKRDYKSITYKFIPLYHRLRGTKKISRKVYYMLIEDPYNMGNRLSTWNNKLQASITLEDCHSGFISSNAVTLSTKIRDFQYRLLANILVFNQQLCDWKIKTSNECSFCHETAETLVHVYFECNKVQTYWQKVKEYIWEMFPHEKLSWDPVCIVLNTVHKSVKHVINMIVLVAKQYIYRVRCEKVAGKNSSLRHSYLRLEVKKIREIEYGYAKERGLLRKHYAKWSAYYDPKEIVYYSSIETFTEEYIANM